MDYKALEIDFFSKNYEIKKHLGSGGFGTTYLCVHNLDRQTYAVKVIPCTDEDTKEKLMECKAMAMLNHNNVVHYYSAWLEAGTPAFARSFVDGLIDPKGKEDEQKGKDAQEKKDKYTRTIYIAMKYYPRVLAEEIKKDGKIFTDEEVRKIFQGLANALAYIHRKKWLHCDFHPGNIFLDEFGNPKVADFGTSRRDDGVVIQSEGKEEYLAKEVLNGEPYTSAADMVSFGLCIMEVVCGIKSDMEKVRIFDKAKVGEFPKELIDREDEVAESVKKILSAALPAARLTARAIIDVLMD